MAGHEYYHRVCFLLWEPGSFLGTSTCWKSTSPIREELRLQVVVGSRDSVTAAQGAGGAGC